jgi:aminoglycoside 3-N-acetyltransferase
VNRSELAAGLRELGVRPGGVLMVHTRMSALGHVVGGSETVVRALLDALGPDGTLTAYASWEEHVYEEDRPAYLASPPVFDPATGAVDPGYGRIPERIRTWPGALRSAHPEAGVVAVGPRAGWLVEPHDDDGYGWESPFARLVRADGQVLLLGAPLDTVTLLHHAEAIASAPGKRRRTYTVRVGDEDRTYTDIDTEHGAYPYAALDLPDDEFAVIAGEALARGVGTRGMIGPAVCHLFPAADITHFGVAWIDERFTPSDSG